jgi:hypothetical protein
MWSSDRISILQNDVVSFHSESSKFGGESQQDETPIAGFTRLSPFICSLPGWVLSGKARKGDMSLPTQKWGVKPDT